jgi:SAM-dependent methyltransferase
MEVDMRKVPNEEMAAAWNGPSGHAWVDEQPLLDEMFRPIEEMLVDAARERGAHRVLDVGCGSGATTLAMARALGKGGHATGVDISAPLIDRARERARQEGLDVTFICADAQTHAFEAERFDLVISRFGVMFFDDPVAAFAHLRSAASQHGALRLVTFRPIAENPFMTVAERAAAPLLTTIPPRRPNAPGQFAFADPAHVRAILESAGWRGAEFAPVDVPCSFPAAALQRYFTRLGPVGQVLRDAAEATRKMAIEKILAAFQPFVQDARVHFTAACWLVSAVAGSLAGPEK